MHLPSSESCLAWHRGGCQQVLGHEVISRPLYLIHTQDPTHMD